MDRPRSVSCANEFVDSKRERRIRNGGDETECFGGPQSVAHKATPGGTFFQRARMEGVQVTDALIVTPSSPPSFPFCLSGPCESRYLPVNSQ